MRTSSAPTVRLPAMEELVSRLPKRDLLALSGFIRVRLQNHVHSALAATKKLRRRGDESPLADCEAICAIENYIEQVLEGSASLMATISKRFDELNEAEAGGETQQ